MSYLQSRDREERNRVIMAKPRKQGEYLHCFIKADIMRDLIQYCNITGLSKTVAVEKAIQSYINSHKTDETDDIDTNSTD